MLITVFAHHIVNNGSLLFSPCKNRRWLILFTRQIQCEEDSGRLCKLPQRRTHT